MTTPYSSYATSTNGQPTYPATQPTSTHFTPVLSSASFDPNQPSTPTPGRGRPRGSATGAKRGRKPKGAVVAGASSPRPFITNTFSAASTPAPTSTPTTFAAPSPGGSQFPRVRWAEGSTPGEASGNMEAGPSGFTQAAGGAAPADGSVPQAPGPIIDPALMGTGGLASVPGTPRLDGPTGLTLPLQRLSSQPPPPIGRVVPADEDVEGDDELLPAMADDDYSAQLSWQSQSKDNLKVLMDNFSPAQYDRFEAYRRHALPKQAVRKVVQQSLGHQVSQPVAQIIAGFAKVFVGEIVEKARAVQQRRGEGGPLSPDHLREAYRAYQAETGHVGAARPIRSKKLFVR